MAKPYPYILIFNLMLGSGLIEGQSCMPDNVCIGETRQYYVDPNPGSTYIWRIDGIVHTGFSANEFEYTWSIADTFLLEVQEISAEGCMGAIRSGLVFVKPIPGPELKIHEAFSPDGDNINDVWNIGNSGMYPKMEITIYNRWGQSVWKSGVGYPEPWDGKSNNLDLPVDSYHYIIILNNGTKPIIGNVTIVR